MVTKTIRSDSRLNRSKLYDTEGDRFWGLPTRPKMVTGDRYVIHHVRDGERLDNISQHYYGTPYYDWVLSDVNDLYRPWAIEVGDTLKIPTKETIARLVSE